MPAPANYSLVFADEFTGLSISNTTTATANWYTAQPWGGGFGSASFLPVGGGSSPFSIVQQGGEECPADRNDAECGRPAPERPHLEHVSERNQHHSAGW
jgi:hypothetical protein